jgi:uncharacterized Zn-finger protein
MHNITESDSLPCSQVKQVIKRSELPLSCPNDHVTLWNGHPKVYIPLAESKEETCPYCGTHYTLVED